MTLPAPRLCHGTYRPEYAQRTKTVTRPLTQREMILECLKDHPEGATLTEVVEMTGLDRPTAQHVLTQLMKLGVERVPITYRLAK